MAENFSYRITRLFGCFALMHLLFMSWVVSGGNLGRTWSRRASVEAEAAASILCSGHGRAFLDGLILRSGKPVCECYSCYKGHRCSKFLPDCTLDVSSGDPIFLEPFWKANAASSSVLVAGWFRMSYEYSDGSLISKELEKRIVKLHGLVGNAVTDGRYIIFGGGSTQLLNAAVYALSANDSSSSPAKVVASAPYYAVYKSQTELFESRKYKFSGDTIIWKNVTNSTRNFIEFVTSPNNPDGGLREGVLHGPFAKQIYDFAYYWPNYTPIPSAVDEDVMLFTLSKPTGHAGSRFGWALIKDKAVYQRMSKYVEENTYGVPRETQLRVLKILDVVLEENGRKMFDFAYGAMKDRWSKIIKIFSSSERFSIQELQPKYCKYFNETRAPSPAYAWIKCMKQEDEDCHAVLKAAKIIGRRGSAYGVEDRYVRLSIINSQDDFDLLQNRLKTVISEESATKQKSKSSPEGTHETRTNPTPMAPMSEIKEIRI